MYFVILKLMRETDKKKLICAKKTLKKFFKKVLRFNYSMKENPHLVEHLTANQQN